MESAEQLKPVSKLWEFGPLLLPVVVAAYLVTQVQKIAYAYLVSAHRRIPGPLINKISGVPLIIASTKLTKMQWIHDLFEKYGPVVQIAPNIIAVNHKQGIKDIYGKKTFLKSSFYTKFATIGQESPCLILKDPSEASKRRKSMLPVFARQNLLAQSDIILTHLMDFMEKLHAHDQKKQSMDAFRWVRYLTFDVVTDLAFNGKYEMVKTGEKDHIYAKHMDGATFLGALRAFIPFLDTFNSLVPIASLRTLYEDEEESLKYPREALNSWKEQRKAGELDPARPDFLNKIILNGEQNPEEALTDEQIIAEIQEVMVAGSDTTAIASVYILWQLARNPDIQDKLYKELKEAFTGGIKDITVMKVEALPYLHGVCNEGLRLHASIATLLERVVPPQGVEIGGHFLAGGTVVGMQAYSVHRLGSVYHDPDKFLPERWFNETEDMKRSLLVFSSGLRACIGQNLARIQLALYISTIIREFSIEVAEGTTSESMIQVDTFTARPKSGKCELYFKARHTR